MGPKEFKNVVGPMVPPKATCVLDGAGGPFKFLRDFLRDFFLENQLFCCFRATFSGG